MDDLDNRIISELRHDARVPLSDLAAALNTSRTTLRARIARLQERGTERITRQLSGFAEVRAVHSTNGRWDVIVEIGTETLEAFDAVLTRIRRLDGIVASETNLLLKTRKAS